METIFAERMNGMNDSFIREILKVTQNPDIISFAGGLPNPDLFPVEAFAEAAYAEIRENGRNALQYSTTEGHLPLREYITNRYAEQFDLAVNPDEILIVNGSQQGIDLVTRALVDKGDPVVIEQPGYLGAIQAISQYQPRFHSVPLENDGMDLQILQQVLRTNSIKMIYAVPNFQNPSGITYSEQCRMDLAALLREHSTVLLEDNPYGDLVYTGSKKPPVKSYLGNPGILLGSFSKITVPGIRMGWVCANSTVMKRLKIVKQAADLHSNYLAQRILYRFLSENDLSMHIDRISEVYKRQRGHMVNALERHLPSGVQFTRPEGGMFLWVTLPEHISGMKLFEKAIENNVAFVPGRAFYLNGEGENTFRLNFSNSNAEQIELGVTRLAESIAAFL